MQGIQSQLLSLANTSYQGIYLFAGTITNTAPFVLNNELPSGVAYIGNNGVNQVAIGNGYQLAVNQPGSQLFSAAGGNDVFLAINNLILPCKAMWHRRRGHAPEFRVQLLFGRRVFYGNG